MSDANVRELERAARLAPDDMSSRLRLVGALARAGRRGDALREAARVRLDALSPDEAKAARPVLDGLWREELSALEPAVKIAAGAVSTIALDPEGALLAWNGQGGLRTADLATGEVLHKDASLHSNAADAVFLASGRVFVITRGRDERDDWRSARIVSFDENGDRPHWEPASVSAQLLSVSPSGDRLLVVDEDKEGVYAWPSQRAICERPSRSYSPIVDWETGHFFSFELGARRIEVLPLEGGRRSSIEVAVPGALDVLGEGVVGERAAGGLTLHSLRGGFRLRLIETKTKLSAPSLSSDARGVRIVLGGKPVRFDVDLERGALVSAPPDLPRPDPRKDRDGYALWHPHADLVVLRKSQNHFELRGLDGEPVRAFPSSVVPFAWTRDGLALVVQRHAGEKDGGSWLELWRASEGRGS